MAVAERGASSEMEEAEAKMKRKKQHKRIEEGNEGPSKGGDKSPMDPEVEEKKKRRIEGEVEGDRSPWSDEWRMDPLVALGSDLSTRVMELLDARSVARSVVVSRAWYQVASADCIWLPKCEDLWKDKAHIPRSSIMRGASMILKYALSVKDGRRKRIMKEDLCDHLWEFRFLKSAPEYWRNLDPSWNGTGPPMRRYFHPDGSHTADPTDKVWGGHECTYSIVTSYVGEGVVRRHYVRINRWPPMDVSRTGDWRWELSNHLYRYNSVPDGDKKSGTGPCFPVW